MRTILVECDEPYFRKVSSDLVKLLNKIAKRELTDNEVNNTLNKYQELDNLGIKLELSRNSKTEYKNIEKKIKEILKGE